jgi:hypothetical protein
MKRGGFVVLPPNNERETDQPATIFCLITSRKREDVLFILGAA